MQAQAHAAQLGAAALHHQHLTCGTLRRCGGYCCCTAFCIWHTCVRDGIGCRGTGTARHQRSQRRLRQHQRGFSPAGFHFDRQRHVLAQKGGRCAVGQRKFDLDGTALCIDGRRQAQHAGGKAPVRKGIGHHGGVLARAQLVQKKFVHLGDQLCWPGQRQAQQRLAGLHDLARLYFPH